MVVLCINSRTKINKSRKKSISKKKKSISFFFLEGGGGFWVPYCISIIELKCDAFT